MLHTCGDPRRRPAYAKARQGGGGYKYRLNIWNGKIIELNGRLSIVAILCWKGSKVKKEQLTQQLADQDLKVYQRYLCSVDPNLCMVYKQ